MAGYITDEDREAFAALDGQADDGPEQPESPPEEEQGEDQPQEEEEGSEEQAGQSAPPDDQAESEPTFTITVNGQETALTRSDIEKGFQLEADYRRKTQQLANERRDLSDAQALLEALNRNPAETLRVLGDHYRLATDDEGIAQPTPEQIRLYELEQWRNVESVRAREAAVDAELVRLHHEYGDFDEEQLFGFAVQRNVADLETALRAMTYRRPLTDKREEKRKVAGQGGGQSHSGASVSKAPRVEINSFHDAYEAAKAELESRSA